LGSLNYVVDFYQNLRKQCKPLFDRLQKNPPPWTSVHTSIVQNIKKYVKTLPCLDIPTINSFKIVEIDASDIRYDGILKQKINPDSPEQIVRFHSKKSNNHYKKYDNKKFDKKKTKCFKCGKYGHFANDCKVKQKKLTNFK
jgi:hypothetical protein